MHHNLRILYYTCGQKNTIVLNSVCFLVGLAEKNPKNSYRLTGRLLLLKLADEFRIISELCVEFASSDCALCCA